MQTIIHAILILSVLFSSLSLRGARAAQAPSAPSVQTSLAAARREIAAPVPYAGSADAAPVPDFAFNLQPRFLRAGKDVRLDWTLSPAMAERAGDGLRLRCAGADDLGQLRGQNHIYRLQLGAQDVYERPGHGRLDLCL